MTRRRPVVKSNSNSALLDRLNHQAINYVNKLWTDQNPQVSNGSSSFVVVRFEKRYKRRSYVAVPVVQHIEPGSSEDSIIGFCRDDNYSGSRFESIPNAARSNSVPVFSG